jgi:hypothetical protein
MPNLRTKFLTVLPKAQQSPQLDKASILRTDVYQAANLTHLIDTTHSPLRTATGHRTRSFRSSTLSRVPKPSRDRECHGKQRRMEAGGVDPGRSCRLCSALEHHESPAPRSPGCIETKLGNRCSWATGITAFVKNGRYAGEVAAIANPASTLTTQLHRRRHDEVSLDEVEQLAI